MLSAMAGLLAYAFIVGGGASVNRATLMAVAYLASRSIDLRGSPFNTLAAAAGLLVAIDPLAVADPAFLLTFGATTGILTLASWPWLRRLPATLRAAVGLLAASVAAEVMLFPVTAAVFSRVTFAGLALNFVAIPAMALAQLAGMATVAIATVSLDGASWIGWLAALGAEGLVRSSDFVQVAPFVTWRVAPPHWLAIALYYLPLTGLVAAIRFAPPRNARRFPVLVKPGLAILGVGAALWILAEPWRLLSSRGDGRLHVTFLDVGQGDATLVRFPRGSAWLVDAGGLRGSSSFDIGDRVVAPVLRHSGIRRLDTLVLTHADTDHIGGASAILREFSPHDVWEGIPVPPFEPLHALRQTAHDRRARWVNVQTLDRTLVDGVEVIVHHPRPADWERQQVRNDDSIVIELRWKSVSVVLTGDIGKETEETIGSHFQPAPIRVLKIPHHGSLSSSTAEFIRALSPRIAVVSTGRANTFGHPAPAVLSRYQDAGAEIFRTDQDGAVTLQTDGAEIRLETFTGRRDRFVAAEVTKRSHEGTKITKKHEGHTNQGSNASSEDNR
jgi:competence protein ComEC